MEHKEAGYQAPPEAPVLCINNCGFFGSATTMNMCSKCHRDLILKQQQAKAADSCTASVGNGSFSDSEKEPVAVATANEESGLVEAPTSSMLMTHASASGMSFEKAKESPNRCGACRKRVGLTGFNCRCGNLFCAIHRYSDKHGCPFDYQGAARDALTRANPVIKSEKLDKI